jgi:hypothetical protein
VLVNNGDNYPGAKFIEITPYYYKKYFNKIIPNNLKINISIASGSKPELL